jgi:hypothetical protein
MEQRRRSGEAEAAQQEPPLWAQRPGEPSLWYDRFLGYCMLGVERSVERTYRIHAALAGKTPRAQPPREWQRAAQRWRWIERAAAWDGAEQPAAEEPERVRQLRARTRRRSLIDRLIAQTAAALEAAHLDEVETDQLRRMVPTLRQLLRDLLSAERAEYARESRSPQPLPGEENSGAPLSDAEIERVRAGLETFHRHRRAGSEGWAPGGSDAAGAAGGKAGSAAGGAAQHPQKVFVCVGDDPALAYDVSKLRAARRETGLALEVLAPCTMADLAGTLRREQANGHPVRWLHLACHAGPDGVAFADGLADGAWLSAQLQGVEVLLLAACRGNQVGDWLAVVPYTISCRDEIAHGDAGQLAYAFWSGLGRGESPAAALDGALRRCPPHVAEMVVRHW